MARAKRGVKTRRRHKRVLKQAKGYFGRKSKLFRVAHQQVMKSGVYAYRDRRTKNVISENSGLAESTQLPD